MLTCCFGFAIVVLYSTMRKLVNEVWALETFDAVKLAKYTRCLFQATLPLDDALAMNLLEESCRKAGELGEVSLLLVSRVLRPRNFVLEIQYLSPPSHNDANQWANLVRFSHPLEQCRPLARRRTRMDGYNVIQPCHRLLWCP